MSLYEALSLLISTAGTVGTVVIGIRQLRQGAAAAPAPPVAPSDPLPGQTRPSPVGPGQVVPGQIVPGQVVPGVVVPGRAGPGQALPGHVEASQPQVGPYEPVARPIGPRRPAAVTAASVLLFLVALLQPVTFLLFLLALAGGPSGEDAGNGVALMMFFAPVGLVAAIPGLLVARGNRGAPWIVWIFGLLAVPLCGLAGLVGLSELAGAEDDVGGIEAAILAGYLAVLALALATSSVLLLTRDARHWFRRPTR